MPPNWRKLYAEKKATQFCEITAPWWAADSKIHNLGSAIYFYTSHLHSGEPQCVPGTLIPNCMGSCHGQILIETATHSFGTLARQNSTFGFTDNTPTKGCRKVFKCVVNQKVVSSDNQKVLMMTTQRIQVTFGLLLTFWQLLAHGLPKQAPSKRQPNRTYSCQCDNFLKTLRQLCLLCEYHHFRYRYILCLLSIL